MRIGVFLCALFVGSLAASDGPREVGAVLPLKCAAGDVFYRTIGRPLRRLHLCAAVDTWTVVDERGVSAGGRFAVLVKGRSEVVMLREQHGLSRCPSTIAAFDGAGGFSVWDNWSCVLPSARGLEPLRVEVSFPQAFTGYVVLVD